jgi:hypothetical protein
MRKLKKDEKAVKVVFVEKTETKISTTESTETQVMG